MNSPIQAWLSKEAALLEAATPSDFDGWFVDTCGDVVTVQYHEDPELPDHATHSVLICSKASSDDAAFIANVRTSHAIAISALKLATIRLEGMILSLEQHGQNINPTFHIDWLKEALASIERLLQGVAKNGDV